MKFYIKQKVFTLKDKYKVMDDNGDTVYYIEGKFISISNRKELKNASGDTVFVLRRKFISLFPTYFLYDNNNKKVATVRKKFSLLRPKFSIRSEIGNLDVKGSIFAYNFDLYQRGDLVAGISKKILAWGDTYELDIIDENHKELLIGVLVVIDQVLHEKA